MELEVGIVAHKHLEGPRPRMLGGSTFIINLIHNVIVKLKPFENCQHVHLCASMGTEMVFRVNDGQKNSKIIRL